MRKRFEYHALRIPDSTEFPNVKLDVFGSKGWEAYGIAPYNGGVIHFLKREIQRPEEP